MSGLCPDDNGHGTHTAGTIVGSVNGIGVAPRASLVVAKALDGNGFGRVSGLLGAMQWMLELPAVPGGTYKWLSGTSMACPHVAGTVALMKSARPSITAAEILKILSECVTDLGAPGKDTRFGFGLIDARRAAAEAARPPSARGGVD